jgi:hypothetical protein
MHLMCCRMERIRDCNEGVRNKLLSTSHNGHSHGQRLDVERYYKWNALRLKHN